MSWVISVWHQRMAVNSAASYLQLRQDLDNIRATYTYAVASQIRLDESPTSARIVVAVPGEAYLITQLTDWLNRYVAGVRQTRTGGNHRTMLRQGKDGRRQLPATLRHALHMGPRKVEVKWIACYLAGVHPLGPTDNAGNPLECSHRCIDQDATGKLSTQYGEECIEAGCLCWESKSANQSRGNNFCARACAHGCGAWVCRCQSLHVPHCH